MAAITRGGSIKKHFRALKDPRVVGRTRHLLLDVIVMAICGVIGNCDDWSDIVLFAQQREKWFRSFLKLPNGVPCHDTFERVFAAFDPRALESCCLAYTQAQRVFPSNPRAWKALCRAQRRRRCRRLPSGTRPPTWLRHARAGLCCLAHPHQHH